MAGRSFIGELRKRKVVQAAAIYGAVAWGVTEIVVTVVEQLFLPQWVSTLAVIGFVVGFPVAMFLSWTFDITRDGIQRTSIISRRADETPRCERNIVMRRFRSNGLLSVAFAKPVGMLAASP